MHAFLALALANMRDIARRPSTLLLAAIGAALILSLRWFSAFGLGYEVVQLAELGVYTIGLLGAIAVVLFLLPAEDESHEAHSLLSARPVSSWTLSAGAFAGRLSIIGMLTIFWVICIGGALLWFRLEDPMLFHYRGARSAFHETARTAGPVLGQWLATAVLLALAQPLARTRRPLLIGGGVLALYALGFTAMGFGGLGALLPDLARQDVTAALWGTPGVDISLSQVLHACAGCAAGIALDSAVLSLRTAT
jgi:hypothetical protein